MIRTAARATLLLAALSPALGQEPSTHPEATDYGETSTAAHVDAFLESLADAPHAARLAVTRFGASHEDRPLTLVTVTGPAPAESALRILVNANIHGGEVEGKEAVQMILREFAHGEHAELLEHAVLHFVPIYNIDGNERIDAKNRASQNGPLGGVGERANAQGLDLNRDFVKAESPECRALLGLFRRLDPHVFMDLHTTNGSAHAYHLTYAPSLSTNIDPALDAFTRDTLLPEVTRELLAGGGFRVWHYGNFTRRGEPAWVTYDHRPRFGTNYYGLRGRIAVLSEAYSYVDFAERVRVTRAFVLETMRAAVRRREVVLALCEAADARAESAPERVRLGVDTSLGDDGEHDMLVAEVRNIGPRRVVDSAWRVERMPARVSFRSARSVSVPEAWALPDPPQAVIENLLLHGVALARTRAEVEVACEIFVPSAIDKSRRLFQGHNEIALQGAWRAERRELPAGTLIVTGRQRLGRVASQLLEPESEDSLSTWNFLEERTTAGEDGQYPVVRLGSIEAIDLQPIAPLDSRGLTEPE